MTEVMEKNKMTQIPFWESVIRNIPPYIAGTIVGAHLFSCCNNIPNTTIVEPQFMTPARISIYVEDKNKQDPLSETYLKYEEKDFALIERDGKPCLLEVKIIPETKTPQKIILE